MKIEKILSYIFIGSIFAVVLVPLFYFEKTYFPFIFGKSFVFRVLIQIAFFSWLALVFLNDKYKPRFSKINLLIGIFALISLLSSLLGVDLENSFWSNFERMEGWITILHLTVFAFLLPIALPTLKSWGYFLNSSLAVNFLVILSALNQKFLWIKDVESLLLVEENRIFGTLGNPIYLSVYALFFFGLSLIFSLRSIKHKSSPALIAVYSILTILNLVTIFYSQTRGTFLGLIAGSGVILILSIFLVKNKKIKMFLAGGFLLLLLAFSSIFFLKNSDFVKNTPILNRIANISLDDSSTRARLITWNIAWQGFKERPILGWGQENFIHVFDKYYDYRMVLYEPWYDRSHNSFIDVAINSGIIGLALYLSIFGLGFWSLVKNKKKGILLSDKLILAGVLVGYAVHNFFVFDNLTAYILFFSLLGFVHYISVDKDEEDERKEKKKSNENITAICSVSGILLLVTFYFLSYGVYVSNSNLYKALYERDIDKKIELYQRAYQSNPLGRFDVAEKMIEHAPQVLSSNLPDKDKQNYFDLAEKFILEEIQKRPNFTRPKMIYMNLLISINQTDRMVQTLEDSLRLSPDRLTLQIKKGVLLYNQNKKEEALKLLEEIFKKESRFKEARDYYVLILIKNNQLEKALEILGQDYEINSSLFIVLNEAGAYEYLIKFFENRINQNQNRIFNDWISMMVLNLKANHQEKAVEILEDMTKNIDLFGETLPAEKEAVLSELSKAISEIKAGRGSKIVE